MTNILTDGLLSQDVMRAGLEFNSTFHDILAAERPRLVRLCRTIIQDSEAAEDVAQEVLFEAWRSIDKLRDPAALRPWLSGIARNVCARWLRARGKEVAVIETEPTPLADSPLDNITADVDLEVALDRDELALLLDRALALLPPNTRDILVHKFVADQPYAVIAEELGLSENAVAVRIHRGKLALQKLLQSDLRTEAENFGLVQADDTWRTTRIWCTQCGQQRLLGRLDATEFVLRCPVCNVEENSYHSQDNVIDYSSLKTFRPALNRFIKTINTLFAQARRDGGVTCMLCGEWRPLRQGMPYYAPPSIQQQRGLYLLCPRCDLGSYISISGLALNHQAGLALWRQEQRIRTLPEVALEVDGVAALHVPFESVKSSARLDVIVREDTYELLAVHNSEAN